MKKYNILSVITTVVIAMMLLVPQSSLLSNNSVQATSQCNCVIFRLDDVEDLGGFDKPNIAIMQHFIDKNHKLSTEIVVNDFGNSGTNGNVYKTVKQGYDAGLFELGIHGFNHVQHSQLSEEQQISDFENSKNKLTSLFGNPNLRLLVPPFNDFDSDTIKAMAETELDIFSSSYQSERTATNVYKVSNSFQTDNSVIQLSEVTVLDSDTGQHLKRRIYHVPYDISLYNMIPPKGTLSGENLISQVVSKADTQIANTGFAVITLHPTDIAPYNSATGTWSNSVDNIKFQDLKDIITRLEAKGYGFSYIRDVTPAPFSEVVPGPSQTTVLTLNNIAYVGWGIDVTVTGKLSDYASGAGIEGATITFEGTGAANLQPVTTNADGTFIAKGKAPSTVATGWRVEAHFDGDSTYAATTSLPKTYGTLPHTVAIALAASKGSVPWSTATSFTATMTDTTAGMPSGTPVTGKDITLDGTGVIGISSSKTTDDNGKATFQGTAPPDVATGWTYQAHFAGDSLYKQRDSSIKTYSTIKHSVTLSTNFKGSTGSTSSTPWSSATSFTVTLTDSSAGGIVVPQKTIQLDGTGVTGVSTDSSSMTTGSDGKIVITGISPDTVNSGWTYQAHFAGDSKYSQRDSSEKSYSTTKRPVTLSLTVPTDEVSAGTSYKVSGTLVDGTSKKQLASKTITFTADEPITIADKTTNTNGFYSATQTAPNTPGSYDIQSRFAGDDLYNSKDSVTRTLEVS
jgi:peptidoglycan/xylan/chitin deacetylase (PgdA/CDA1 family)